MGDEIYQYVGLMVSRENIFPDEMVGPFNLWVDDKQPIDG